MATAIASLNHNYLIKSHKTTAEVCDEVEKMTCSRRINHPTQNVAIPSSWVDTFRLQQMKKKTLSSHFNHKFSLALFCALNGYKKNCSLQLPPVIRLLIKALLSTRFALFLNYFPLASLPLSSLICRPVARRRASVQQCKRQTVSRHNKILLTVDIVVIIYDDTVP